MNDATTKTDNSFAPLPLREVTEDERFPGELPVGLIASHGYCTTWCNVLEDSTRTDGATVEEHGPWCLVSRGGVDGCDYQGEGFSIYPGLAHMYKHGVYQKPLSREGLQTFVQLSLYGKGITPDDLVECKMTFLTTGEARNLAALLVYLADEADSLHQPIIGREPRHG